MSQPQIENNDDWIEAVTNWQATALARFLTGQELTVAQKTYISLVRSQVGPPPESPAEMAARYKAEGEAKFEEETSSV